MVEIGRITRLHCCDAALSGVLLQGCRIDFVLVSAGLLDRVVSCEHLYSTPPKWCTQSSLWIFVFGARSTHLSANERHSIAGFVQEMHCRTAVEHFTPCACDTSCGPEGFASTRVCDAATQERSRWRPHGCDMRTSFM